MKALTMVLGVVLILVGVIGFVNNPVMGLFAVDTMHNLVHILTGALLLYAGYAGGSIMRRIAQVLGIVYLLVTILGFVAPDMANRLMAINGADNILHALLTIVFLGIGFMPQQRTIDAIETPPTTSR